MTCRPCVYYNDIRSIDGTYTVAKYTGSAKKLKIPDNVDGVSVTGIGDDAFADCAETLTIYCSEGSAVWGYCERMDIKRMTI